MGADLVVIRVGAQTLNSGIKHTSLFTSDMIDNNEKVLGLFDYLTFTIFDILSTTKKYFLLERKA